MGVPASLDLPVETVFEDDGLRYEVHRKPYGVIAATTRVPTSAMLPACHRHTITRS